MHGRLRAILWPLLVLFGPLSGAGLSRGQELPKPQLLCDSDLVVVPTVVMDKDYRLIHDLKADNFEMEVDRAPMRIANFWREQEPVSAVIVFDASGSMKSVLKHSREAVEAFLRLAHPEDEYALVLCKEHVEVAVPFTQNLSEIRDVASISAAKGSTPLYDSLDVALKLMRKGRHTRKVILIVSDGEDTASRLGYKAIRSRILESSAYVYSVQFWTGQSSDEFLNRELKTFADLTGGVYVGNLSDDRFVDLFTKLDIHERYILTFQPHEQAHDARWHKIVIHLKDAEVNKPRVYWRRAYSDKPLDYVD